ncbi:MAG: hypothetical protein GF334_13855 [Candidatus Altiarchaeales archaeon]|nr:hypothetical protein [Candidatus Altiarchaeales archaeon]
MVGRFILFLLTGALTSHLIYPRLKIIKRIVYCLLLSVSLTQIMGVALIYAGLNTPENLTLLLAGFNLIVAALLHLKRGVDFKTFYEDDLKYVLGFSFLGALFRLWFWDSIYKPSDAYAYAYRFIGKQAPDLGFYTGMAADRSPYIGLEASELISGHLIPHPATSTFLITLTYLGFIYIVFKQYRDRRHALLGVALMSLGPIELFHLTTSLAGHSLSYVILFPLFLLYTSRENKIIWIILPYAVAMNFTYYTASMITLIASLGFTLSTYLRDLNQSRNPLYSLRKTAENPKTRAYLTLAFIVGLHVYLLSNMWEYSLGTAQDQTTLDKAVMSLTQAKAAQGTYQDTVYRNPEILFLSAIRWQALYFLFLGLTFLIHLLWRGRFTEQDVNLFLCLIPVALVSYGFIHVNLTARVFDYFAFYALMAARIPKKHYKNFFILSAVFILLTTLQVAQDKKVFFETPVGEVQAAQWISQSLRGRVFSDQFFINQLILKGYYNVTGAREDNPLVLDLFYRENQSLFLDAIQRLNTYSVDYVALTGRMRDEYVLMLNQPQKPLGNTDFFGETLKKTYDNGDVRVYELNSSLNYSIN